MADGDIEAPAPPPPGAPPGPPDGGEGDGGAARPAPTRIDAPENYSFLTTEVIKSMCTMFEEESKGQSNRELHADFLSLFESAPELTLGPEIGSAIKRRNATDALCLVPRDVDAAAAAQLTAPHFPRGRQPQRRADRPRWRTQRRRLDVRLRTRARAATTSRCTPRWRT